VLWPARHFEALARVTGDRGGRDLLREFLDQVVEVEVADDGVLRDVDTPDDLHSPGGRESSSSSDVE
jgi:molybdenum cofactor cytidylyltransferase